MSKGSAAIAAFAALFVASSATAEPAQPSSVPAKSAAQPARIAEPAQIVLASVTPVAMPQPRKEDQAAPGPKKRTARVTTCRCGDPDPR